MMASAHEEPDIMNDPRYDANTGEDGGNEVELCRICRGEATETEQLFYPCKCSGSIKFVHQDCLMEWLSHSQKKHCELCKTPFRFTKLYSPNMPQSLPNHIFLRHLVIHIGKNMTTWLRFCLVVTVWLGWLPWTMRQVWGFLFWFGDGGWVANHSSLMTARNSSTLHALASTTLHLENLTANGTSPVSPLLATPTSSAAVGTLLDGLPSFLRTYSPTLNFTDKGPLTGILKAVMYGLGLPILPDGSFENITAAHLSENHTVSFRPPSLLSDVAFLKTLTRHPGLNRIIIATLEGQIITVLVVVCFILVFLIREWVVQQQPGINMGNAFNEEVIRVAVPRERNAGGRIIEHDPPGNADPLFERAPEREPARLGEAAIRLADEARNAEPARVGDRPIAQPRRRNVARVGQPEDGQVNALRLGAAAQDEFGGPADQGRSQTSRPGMPNRDALSPAVEIQRQLTDSPHSPDEVQVTQFKEFLTIWRRADGNPDEVLRIIESEDLHDKLLYWVRAMKLLKDANAAVGGSAVESRHLSTGGDTVNDVGDIEASLEAIVAKVRAQGASPARDDQPPAADSGKDSSTSSESWEEISAPGSSQKSRKRRENSSEIVDPGTPPSNTRESKGKERATDDVTEPLFDSSRNSLPGFPLPVSSEHAQAMFSDSRSFASSTQSGRPRAISDGPALKEAISPLGHGNWSFSNIISEKEAENSREESADDVDDWKQTQARRVEEAVRKGREAQSLRRHQASSPVGDSSAEPENNIESAGDRGTTTPLASGLPPTPAHELAVWDEDDEDMAHTDASGEFEDSDNESEPEEPQVENDAPAPDTAVPAVQRRNDPQGPLGRIADWLWGDIGNGRDADQQAGNDEHIVHDIAAEAPFVPVAQPDPLRDQPEQDREVVAAAFAAGLDPNDPDAIEDAEDFEGIMELVGMRGPITGLVQNGMFSAVLISLTVACGVWIPYNIGRAMLLIIANPIPTIKVPLRFIFSCAALVQDISLVLAGIAMWLLLAVGSLPAWLFSLWQGGPNIITALSNPGATSKAWMIAKAACQRIADGALNVLANMVDSEFPAFSAYSHESLLTIKAVISDTIRLSGNQIITTVSDPTSVWKFLQTLDVGDRLSDLGHQVIHGLMQGPYLLIKPASWVISLDVSPRATPLDPKLVQWNGTDRFLAIMAGYATLSLVGSWYLRRGSPISKSQTGREWEATLVDVLNQAGGVMKVILIISIEMLVFPLYCGLLLDLALLPLFEGVTVLSRIMFTMNSPLTSTFVHWFVGTCYMFHFALFVSMCRKIMRTGVLYFIRDPDDPTFHPVRDVLERNVATQLRKITFSALVYGALVVVCLGGVVWGLAYSFNGVLPIHWSSNEPVLEFPIDLLFYNFFMPLAVRFFKPSDGLHAMYRWWFRKCARILRLTWFLFDEPRRDEEGYHVRRTWQDVFMGIKGDMEYPMDAAIYGENPFEDDPSLRAYFRLNGRYVRAPASDQVRIPKGSSVFLDVTRDNERVDGLPDRDEGLHGRRSDQFKRVYVPPNFRTRVFLFILFIWLFAAITGVCITIVPLVFGRKVFAAVIPEHVRKNDIYAFSIGIYIMGSVLYAILHLKQGLTRLRHLLAHNLQPPATLLRKISTLSLRTLRIVYTYGCFAFVIPSLFALIVEFYLIIPLHTYFYPSEQHVVHFVQSWTLGLLYVKLTTRLISWSEGRVAEAMQRVGRGGWLDPDVRVATRCFVIPAVVILGTALALPLPFGWVYARIMTVAGKSMLASYGSAGLPLLSKGFASVVAGLAGNDALARVEAERLVFRYAYPAVLGLAMQCLGVWALVGVLRGWRQRIRDEVYLIGERLHNFGERKGSAGHGVGRSARIET